MFGVRHSCWCLVNVVASPQGSTTPRGSSTTGVRSKVGSMDNAAHTPGGGNVSTGNSELKNNEKNSNEN